MNELMPQQKPQQPLKTFGILGEIVWNAFIFTQEKKVVTHSANIL